LHRLQNSLNSFSVAGAHGHQGEINWYMLLPRAYVFKDDIRV